MIINIVIIIKKITEGKDATLLGDFALEPSENFKIDFADSIEYHFTSDSNKSYIILKVFQMRMWN